MTLYRNAAAAFRAELAAIWDEGDRVEVRGHTTKELVGRSFSLDRPLERCITVPGRLNSITAAIVESVWVLAGRDDIAFLLPYLPRAAEFSDDGESWRGGYGPRIRTWAGTDQLDEVRRQLIADPLSRRAVVALFDPARDFVKTRDVPCNNWLHFLVRDGALQLAVAIRSNDIWWGFSGINSFEWSVLHEAMSSWLGVRVGRQHYFISSEHLYDRHFVSAQRVLASQQTATGYPSGTRSLWRTPWSDLSSMLESWFSLEADLRDGQFPDNLIDQFGDPLLRDFLRVVRVEWAIKHGASDSTARRYVAAIDAADLRQAAAVRLDRLRSSG